jgi:hypothetical protein
MRIDEGALLRTALPALATRTAAVCGEPLHHGRHRRVEVVDSLGQLEVAPDRLDVEAQLPCDASLRRTVTAEPKDFLHLHHADLPERHATSRLSRAGS